MKTRMTTALIALTAAAGSAFGQCSSSTASACETEMTAGTTGTVMTVGHTEQADNIVVTASKAGAFNTLLAAAKAAGLAEALMGDGPFTVFAPTDDAFAALPKGTVESLLKPENKGKLAAILKYHVVSGELTARDVTRLSGAKSLNGQRINFGTSTSGVNVDSATVVQANIECSNGIIHVIDSVILPGSDTLAEVAESAGMFSTLLTAAQAAGLVPALSGDTQLTIFAPTDEAFAALPKGTVQSLLKPENKDQLVSILTYHVVAGRVYAADAVKAGMAETLNGQKVVIDIADGQLRVDNAKIIKTDIDASNGVVHVIDRVILPE